MKKESQEILVIGGGVIGLCAGWYLGKAGHRVRILDRESAPRESCSDRNAGMIVPSHFIPLASPGVIWQGLKWMLNSSSPFSIKPTLDPGLWAWCWKFARHSNAGHVAGCQELLRDLSLESRRLFVELEQELDFDLVQRGLLMLCQSEEGLAHEIGVADAANALGVLAEICEPDRLRELDPGATMKAIGGIWFPQDCHLDSLQFLAALRKGIERCGGEILREEATAFTIQGNGIGGIRTTSGEEYAADAVVLAGGAWTPEIAKRLKLRLPMQAGKGYSLTLAKPRQLPQLCSLLKEARVAVTPMGDQLRVAGTMEICGNDLTVNRKRLGGIIDSFCRFFPEFEPGDFAGIEPWSGLRPCSPDGLPYIGKVPGLENAIIATGHSMLGLSLGPVTGCLVSELISAVPPRIDLDRLAPERFG